MTSLVLSESVLGQLGVLLLAESWLLFVAAAWATLGRITWGYRAPLVAVPTALLIFMAGPSGSGYVAALVLGCGCLAPLMQLLQRNLPSRLPLLRTAVLTGLAAAIARASVEPASPLYSGLGLLILPSLLIAPLFLTHLAQRKGRLATGLLTVAALSCFLAVILLRDAYYRDLLSSGHGPGA
jgi:hypothetical protein